MGEITVRRFIGKTKVKDFECENKMVEVALKMDQCTGIQETFGKYPAFHPSPILFYFFPSPILI